jgi:hypothetical protein
MVEPLLSGLQLTVNSINHASHQYAVHSPLSVCGRSCEWIAVRISTPEKKMASERVNKQKRMVLSNVFLWTFSRKIPERRTYNNM